MPIYFATPASENQKVPEPLRKKGLHFLRTSPTAFKVHAVPKIIHHYYTYFVGSLYLILAAIFRNRSVFSGEDSYYLGAKPPHIDYFPFECPPMAVSFTQMTDHLRAWLVENGYQAQEINGVSMWCKEGGSTKTEIMFLMQNPTTILTTRIPWSYINVQTAIGMMHMIKFLSLLAIALQLPAIDTKDHFTAYAQTGRKRKYKDNTDGTKTVESIEYEGSGFLSCVSSWLGLNAHTPASHLWKVSDSHVARPAKTSLPIVALHTALGEFEEGHWFPYEEDIYRVDDDGPVQLLSDHCYLNFGTDDSNRTKMIETLKSAWGVLKKTSTGSQLAHFGKGISLAIQGQAGIRAIFSNDFYEGFILVGYQVKIITGNQTFLSSPYASLVTELSKFVSHDQAIRQIHKLLTGMDVGDETDLSIYESMSNIRNLVLSNQELTTSKINDLIRYASRLRFRQRPWSSNYQNIVFACDIISARRDLDESCPIAPEMIANEDIVSVVLSCFGRACPSLVIPDGRKISLTRPMPAQTVRTIDARGNKSARSVTTNDLELTIQARLVSLETAISDWKWMIENREYKVAPLATARANSYKIFKGSDRGVLFDALKNMVNTEATTQGRPRDNDNEGIGRIVSDNTIERVGEGFEFVCIPVTEVRDYLTNCVVAGYRTTWVYWNISLVRFICVYLIIMSLSQLSPEYVIQLTPRFL